MKITTEKFKSVPILDAGDIQFSKLTAVKCLIYYDGPLLMLYKNKLGENVLFSWVDVDSDCNRWLVCNTPNNILDDYLNKKISLRDVFHSSKTGYLYLADFDQNVFYSGAWMVLPGELPNDYLPTSDSFYEYISYTTE